MENSTNNFVEGLFVKLPNKAAPDFVLLDMSFKTGEFTKWCQDNTDEKGWVNVQILRSKDGSKIYGKLNEWKPKRETQESKEYNDTKYKNVDTDTGETIPKEIFEKPVARTSPTEDHPEGLPIEDLPF